jgi:hypothetical protein
LVERWRGDRTSDATSENESASETVASEATARENETTGAVASADAVASATAVVCVAATWASTLELQGWPEDKIVAALPIALRPVEETAFDSPDASAKALAETREEIRKLREN